MLVTNCGFGWKQGFIPAGEGRGSRSLWAELLGLFARQGGGGLTASSICLCLGSANYLCTLGFLPSFSRCFVCATGGIISERRGTGVQTPLGGG